VTSKYSSSRVPVFYPLAVFHSSILDTPDNLKVRSIARQAAGPSHLIQVDLTAKYQLISPVLNTLHT
jgi:hypothetical protein